MQHARAMNILSSQSNLARRVFAAVPIQAFWTVQEISVEMHRLENHKLNKGEIMGCLRTLVDAGLVNETASLTFRSNVKPQKESASVIPKTLAPSEQMSLMDRIAIKAQAMRMLADDLEMLGLEAEEAIKAASADSEKLKQFQLNLKQMMS